MEILTGEEMRRVDRRTIEELGVPSILLMESAGRGVAESLLQDYPHAASHGILVLCGKGNNGGDGLAAARHLARLGVTPRVLLFARADQVQGDAALYLRAVRGSGLAVDEVPDEVSWSRFRTLLERPLLVVDALLGTGIRGGPHGLVAAVIRDVNDSAADVVSVDIPSGLNADSPIVEGAAVGADRTYTLCRPKLPLVLEPGSLHAGRWTVIPIGVPDEAVAAERPSLEWLDGEAVNGLLPSRSPQAHKGDLGHLLAVAGSVGKSGAAGLVALGALRAGIGLITVATPVSARPEVAAQRPEVMTEPLPETRSGALARSSASRALSLLDDRDALAIGPGLGTESETRSVVHSLVSQRKAPAVVDADGLNALAVGEKQALSQLKADSWPLVLTPHPGEAARLLDTSTRSIQEDRLEAARRLAEQTGGMVALKGHRTLVASPDGRVSLNASGNPGMATAGMGDLLTGIVGAFLARGMKARDAARLAVFVHGDAGDRAAAAIGEESMTATDLSDHLPQAMAALGVHGEPRPW